MSENAEVKRIEEIAGNGIQMVRPVYPVAQQREWRVPLANQLKGPIMAHHVNLRY